MSTIAKIKYHCPPFRLGKGLAFFVSDNLSNEREVGGFVLSACIWLPFQRQSKVVGPHFSPVFPSWTSLRPESCYALERPGVWTVEKWSASYAVSRARCSDA